MRYVTWITCIITRITRIMVVLMLATSVESGTETNSSDAVMCYSCSYTRSSLPYTDYECVRFPENSFEQICRPPWQCKVISINAVDPNTGDMTHITSAARGCYPSANPVCSGNLCCSARREGVPSRQCEQRCFESLCNDYNPEEWLVSIEGNTKLPSFPTSTTTTTTTTAATSDSREESDSSDSDDESGSIDDVITTTEPITYITVEKNLFDINVESSCRQLFEMVQVSFNLIILTAIRTIL